MIRRLRHRLHGEDGMTVVELTVASLLLMIIIVSVFSMLDSGTKTERGQQARHDALLGIRAAMTRISRDVRPALSVGPTSTSTRLAVQTYQSGATDPVDVVYELVADRLTRSVNGGAATTILEHVVASPVFCYHFDSTCLQLTPTANLASIRVTVSVFPEVGAGTSPITLATDIELRNL